MPGTWHAGVGLIGLLALAVPAVGPALATPPSHPAPNGGGSGSVSFSPPRAAAFLERPVPAGNGSGTNSGDRPLAVILDRPVVPVRAVPTRPPVEQVTFQAAAPSGVPLAPPPGMPSAGNRVEMAPMPRTMEPPLHSPSGGTAVPRTVPVPATPTAAPEVLGMPTGPSTTQVPLSAPTVVGDPGIVGHPSVVGETFHGYPHDIWYSEGDSAPCCGGGCDSCPGCYAPCCGDGRCGPIRRFLSCWDGGCGGPECDAPFDDTFFFSADYLLMWMQGSKYPVLITQSPPGVQPLPGTPGVFTSLGGSSVNRDEFSGMRFRGGMWFDQDHCLGLEGSYMALGDATNGVSISAPLGLPVLSVPLDPANPTVIAAPGFPGSISATMRSEFNGADVNLRRNLWLGPQWNVDGLVGFRYLGLRDDFTFSTQTFGGLARSTSDVIRTRNHFYGGQVGLVGEADVGCWTFGFRTASAVGQSTQSVDLSGRSTVNGVTFNRGLLLPGANGIDTRSRLAFVQDVGVSASYRFSECFRATVGYNLVYWGSVVRPGEQIGNVMGATNGAGFNPNETTFWAQGLTLGLEFRY